MASGYDVNSQVPFRLVKGRLGVYEKEPFNADGTSIDGVFHQEDRLT